MTTPLRVLVVDDERVDRIAVQRFLTSAAAGDFCVTEAADGRAASSAIAQERFDCILLDLHLPDTSGIEWLSALPSGLAPVVMLTAFEDEATALSALKLGAQDYLVKDHLTASLLVRTIRYAIERGRVRTSEEEPPLHASDGPAETPPDAMAAAEKSPGIRSHPIVRLLDNVAIGHALAFGPHRPTGAVSVDIFGDRARALLELLGEQLGSVRETKLFLAVPWPKTTTSAMALVARLSQQLSGTLAFVFDTAELEGPGIDCLERRERLSGKGVNVALGGVDLGPRSLELALALAPDWLFLKADVLAHAARDRRVATVLERFARTSASLGATLIAEGLATHAEVTLARNLGLHTGMGPLFPARLR